MTCWYTDSFDMLRAQTQEKYEFSKFYICSIFSASSIHIFILGSKFVM